MNRIAITLALALGTSAFASGCGTLATAGSFRSGHVQHVVRGERAGVIALHGPIVPATADAHMVMTEECDGRWRRLEGEQAVALVREDAQAKAESDGGADGASEADEWRMDDDRLIAYECMTR